MQFVKKIAYRHRALFCYIVIVWGFGTILATVLLGYWSSWNHSKIDNKNDVKQMMQKRTVWLSVKHPKSMTTMKYCGPPHSIMFDQEGHKRSSDRLELVIVMVRHGDRGPMHNLHNLSSIDCGVNVSQHRDLATFFQDVRSHVSRRTARDPFRGMQPAEENSPCKPGHLTPKGTLQLLRVGQKLRQVYVDQLKLLPLDWTTDQVSVTSTLVERTYQSAVAFLYGFLPGFHLGRLAFRVGLGPTFCHSQPFCRCELADQLRRRVDARKKRYVLSHPAVGDLGRRLELMMGLSRWDDTPGDPDDVFDRYLAYVCHRVPLPCASDGLGCATMEQVNGITAFVEWRGKQMAKSSDLRLSSRLAMHGLLADVLGKLSAHADAGSSSGGKRKKKRRFSLYSAHDSTLMPLLVALGVLDGSRPPYSSRLTWELYSGSSRPNGTRYYHVRVVYNGKDITKRMTFCRKEMSQPSKLMRLCPLENFRDFVRDGFLTEMNATSYQRACAVPTTTISTTTTPTSFDWETFARHRAV